MAENISALGVRVIGDISTLGTIPPGMAEAADPEFVPPVIPAEAAVQAVVGAFAAGGAAGRPRRSCGK
jgi:hypothetical protein